ncbi:MAG: caspase family protein [Pseudomonadota bacterium]
MCTIKFSPVKTLCMAFFASVITTTAFALDVRGLSRKGSTPFSDGTFRALVIGNNAYRDPTGTWKPLRTAVADAKSVAEVLREEYGFADVEVLLDATQRDILKAIDALGNRTKDNDSVIVYYAGHGYKEDDKDRAFWVPVDGVGQDFTTFIRNSTIRDEIALLAERAKHTMLISDSCFSGTLLRTGNRGAAVREGARYYEKVANKKSVQILAAGGQEFVDDNYKGSGHSPFTYFLLNELKHNKSPLLSAGELAANVEKAVANNVEQTPESGVLASAGDELGELIFSKINIKIELTAEPAQGRAQPANIPITVEAPVVVSGAPVAAPEASKPAARRAADNRNASAQPLAALPTF